jgi:hypothetical protein
MQEVIEQHLKPLASTFLDLLCQSTFTLAREQGKTSHIATVLLQNRQVTILRRRGLRLTSLQRFAADGCGVRQGDNLSHGSSSLGQMQSSVWTYQAF